MLLRKRNVLIQPVLPIICVLTLVLANSPPTCRAESPAEQKIRAALAEPTSFKFIETPLKDVAEYLKDLHKIEIHLDIHSIDSMGISSDSVVTFNLKGVSLRSALTLLLNELHLTFIIKDDVLLITSPDVVDAYVTIKTYSTAELISDAASSTALTAAVELALDQSPEVVEANRLALNAWSARIFAAIGKGGPPPERPETPRDLRPASRVLLFRGLLVVRANPKEHDRIEELLSQIRKQLKQTEPAARAP